MFVRLPIAYVRLRSFIRIESAYGLSVATPFLEVLLLGTHALESFFLKSADAPTGTNACCPVDGLNRIFVTSVQLRVLCPGSRAVRVLFSCPESRTCNFCLVFANEMHSDYLVFLSFVGAAFRVHGLCYNTNGASETENDVSSQ
jgi:hypothetical protein